MTPFSAFWTIRYGSGFRSGTEISSWHEQQIQALRREVMPASPFYRAYAGTPPEDWPVMNRALVMEHFSEINLHGIGRDRAMELALGAEKSRRFDAMIGDVAIGLSAGTSGQRGLYLSNRHDRALWTAQVRARILPRAHLSRHRVACFMRADNPLFQSLGSALLRYEFFDLHEPFCELLARLQELNPSIIIAPPSLLVQLARAQRGKRIRLQPEALISVAEVLYPEESAITETVFGLRPQQIYHAAEGSLAFTCKAGNLHLNERFIRFERDILNPETGAFCPILTDFSRTSLPLLRYRLDDVLIPEPRPCPCGCASQRIAAIEGRADDMLEWAGLEGGTKIIPAELLRRVITGAPVPVRDYRAIFEEGVLTLWIETSVPEIAIPALRNMIEDLAGEQNCRLPELRIRQGLPPADRGKRRRVVVIRPRNAPAV